MMHRLEEARNNKEFVLAQQLHELLYQNPLTKKANNAMASPTNSQGQLARQSPSRLEERETLADLSQREQILLIEQVLASVKFFRDRKVTQLTEIAKNVMLETHPPGKTICEMGARGSKFYIIHTG